MESPRPTATRACYPSAVLLETNANFDDGVNSTTAHALTSAGDTVRVTFCLSSPPFVSHFCLPHYNYPGPMGADVVSSAKYLVLLRFAFSAGSRHEHFVYQAAGNNRSSLRLIPHIHQRVPYPACILPCDDDDDGEFLVAVLSDAPDRGRYVLDVFSSKTNKWFGRPLKLQASPAMGDDMPGRLSKVVALGGRAVGWIDLWRGILVCDDVLEDDPVLRFVPLPKPGFGFGLRRRTGSGNQQQVRDVTFCDGFIKFVEVECRFKEVLVNDNAKKSSFKTTHDLEAEDIIYDSELLLHKGESVRKEKYALVPDGWKIRTCYRHISWDYWRKGHVVDSDEIAVCNPEHCRMLPQLWDYSAGGSALGNLAVSDPTLSTRTNDDVIYLMCKVDIHDPTRKKKDRHDRGAWMVGVDLGKKTVEVVENIVDYFQPPFLSCSFSGYLNTTPRHVL